MRKLMTRCRVATKERVQDGTNHFRHGTAGIHAAPGRAGTASALTSDPLPWRARAQHEVAL